MVDGEGKLIIDGNNGLREGLFMKKQILLGFLLVICFATGLVASEQKAYKDMSPEEKCQLARQDSAKMRAKPKMTASNWFSNWYHEEGKQERYGKLEVWRQQNMEGDVRVYEKNLSEQASQDIQWAKDKQSVEQWKNQEREWREKMDDAAGKAYLCQDMLSNPNHELRQDLRESRKGWMPWISFKLRYLFDPMSNSTIAEYENIEKLLEEKIESDLVHEVWLLEDHEHASKSLKGFPLQKTVGANAQFLPDYKIFAKERDCLRKPDAIRPHFKSSLSFKKKDRELCEMLAKE